MSGKTQEICEREVDKFHALLNEGKFKELFDASGQELKDVTSEEEFTQFLDAVHRKLGAAGEKKLTGWHVNYNTRGNFVDLGYETTFAGDKAAEKFTFIVSGDQARLVGYHVNSKALIIK
jgi:hypothetical protein